jgi:putative secretion ATPase (PEP-CTERM system associated)
MYEAYFGLSAKPFQLRPDPRFFFGSKGHKHAMAYLQYGLSQAEGFIVITGEVGAGKTTLVRHLFRELDSTKIVAAQIVNTHLNADDALRMVAAAFGLPLDSPSKAVLIMRIEKFLQNCDQHGKRALLVVDEAQNLGPQTIEELRMLSNFQTANNSLLQIFLLGQPEFRKTLMSAEMLQLRQRVIATYHLGPMDSDETRTYIEHRLRTAGWTNDPHLADDTFLAIHAFTGGVPRKINTLCDRLFLMAFLEELHELEKSHVDEVISDIQGEFNMPQVELEATVHLPAAAVEPSVAGLEYIDKRLVKIERGMYSLIDAMQQLHWSTKLKNSPEEHN